MGINLFKKNHYVPMKNIHLIETMDHPMSVVEHLPTAWPVFPMKPLVNIEKAIEHGHL